MSVWVEGPTFYYSLYPRLEAIVDSKKHRLEIWDRHASEWVDLDPVNRFRRRIFPSGKFTLGHYLIIRRAGQHPTELCCSCLHELLVEIDFQNREYERPFSSRRLLIVKPRHGMYTPDYMGILVQPHWLSFGAKKVDYIPGM